MTTSLHRSILKWIPTVTDVMRYRYRLKNTNSSDYLEHSWATRDLAILECRSITKRDKTTLFVIDSSNVPSLLIGACSNGLWRNATGSCKTCGGKGHCHAGGATSGFQSECGACFGYGVRIEPMPWVSA